MHLCQLTLANFKNIESLSLDFSSKVNCFVGLNGAGKTNILDSIYYLSFCKSFFNIPDKLNIRRGADFFSIHGQYSSQGMENELVSCIQKQDSKKIFRCNKKTYLRLSDHIGKFPLVMISPCDSELIQGGSEGRRKFVDGLISQFNPTYLDSILKYSRSLLQRNELLKRFLENRYYDADSIAPWDEQLIAEATFINEVRRSFLVEFLPIFYKYYEMVSGTAEKVDIEYDSRLNEADMRSLLSESSQHDLYSAYTNVGVHKDDFVFTLDGNLIRKFGSQGQQKSFVVAIRLAQFDFIYQKLGYKPIMLLDDIFDKLDDNRVSKLVHLVGDEHFGQVFITDTQRQRIEYLFENTTISHKIFNVESGCVAIED